MLLTRPAHPAGGRAAGPLATGTAVHHLEPAMLLKAQKFQRMAEALLRVQQMTESKGADPVRARRHLEKGLEELGVDLEVVRLLDAGTLADSLAGDPGKLWGAAEALYLEGLLAVAEDRRTEARERFRKARRLFARLEGDLELPEETVPPGKRLRDIETRLE